jgi:N-hydroxyarylamine O-acetyltransferase
MQRHDAYPEAAAESLHASGESGHATLPAALKRAVGQRLGLGETLPLDISGLRALYAAWCRNVPFDNVRKLIALRTGDEGPLPGGDAVDFLEHWLAHGTGGTCWSSSNALYELVASYGFDARRVAGSMRDLGVPGHGSVKVNIDGADWLVDSSMLIMHPIPLTSELHVDRDPLFGVEVEPSDGSHLIWFDTPPYDEYFPCRLLIDPVDHAFYLERYEISRTRGPFNHHLSVRYNRGEERTVLQGHTRHTRTRDTTRSEALSPEQLCAVLREDVGMSAEMVERWADCGALDAAYEPAMNPPAPLTGRPPSRRVQAD